MKFSRRHWIKTAAGLVLPAWAAGGATIIIPGPRYNSFGAAYNAQTLDWVARVISNGGTVSTGTKDAADALVVAVNGFRSKLLRFNLYAGTGLDACRTPLINDNGSTSDTLANFVSGDYSEATGLTGNGSTKYNSTGFQASTDWASVDSCCCGAYVRTHTSTTDAIMGASGGSSSTDYLLVSYGGTTTYASCHSDAAQISYSDSNGLGHYAYSRESSSSLILYKNAVSKATTATPGGSTAAQSIFVHAFLASGVASAHSSRTIAGYYIATGLTPSEMTTFDTAWQAFQTTLGRNV